MKDKIAETLDLNKLNTEEREVVYQLMKEFSETGDSSVIEELWMADYEEVPVSIEQFITDDQYLGRVYDNGKIIYPFWRKQLSYIYGPEIPIEVFEYILTGCLTGDTLIPLTDGRVITLQEMYESGWRVYELYAYDLETNRYVPARTSNVIDTGIKDVYCITLDKGKDIKATSNHRFLTEDKQWKSIDSGLAAGDKLLYFSDTIAKYEPGSCSLKVVSIKYLGEERVYDLTVPKYHNFATQANIVAHNSIGLGKTTIAVICTLYELYKMLCLKDPHRFYGLVRNKPIVFAMMNLTLDLAKGGMYKSVVDAAMVSPWFREHVDFRGSYHYRLDLPKNIKLIAGSTTDHSIGEDIFMAVMDEMNFSSAKPGSKKSMLDMYSGVRTRMESRFLKQGLIPGKLILVSSKKSDQDFLDQYIQSLKGSKSTYIIDEAVYNVKPPETYLGPKFRVAVGDKTKPSRIMGKDETDESLIAQGYRIIQVPTEYYESFSRDMERSLRDIAGISGTSTGKLIPYPGRIESCVDYSYQSPMESDEIIMGLDDDLTLMDYIRPGAFPLQDSHIPRFAHIDIGLTNDALGLSIVHADKLVSVERYTQEGKIESVVENTYKLDLVLRVRATFGSEVPLYKVRKFLLYLINNCNVNLRLVTFDGFQSRDSIQLLTTAGVNTGLLSVDRTDEQYLNLRSAILENRIILYNHPALLKELEELEHDLKHGKVDHPLNGSKDCADSLCGAIWNAQKYYAEQRSSTMIQQQNSREALAFVQQLNKQRWAQDNYAASDELDWLSLD